VYKVQITTLALLRVYPVQSHRLSRLTMILELSAAHVSRTHVYSHEIAVQPRCLPDCWDLDRVKVT